VGFHPFIKKIRYDEPNTLTEAIQKATYMYEQVQGRESMQKYWKDKKKEKYDQRRKGFKPPFNRNELNKNHQYHYAKDDSKKEDSLEKRGITPIKCWGCKEDHLHKDFPHRKDRVNTVHNIQEDKILKDMGRIYAFLDDRKEEYQSNMIKVEGKIINHHVSILIDPGASHCYIKENLLQN
jgi:hypothetical protein